MFVDSQYSRLKLMIMLMVTIIVSSACMRIEPTHPYDPDSPPEYRAPASLISALFSNEIPQDFDYSVFTVNLEANNFEGSYSQRPSPNGTFSFQGIPPGVYLLSAEGEVNGILYGIISQEIFLAVGEKVTPPFFDINALEE